MDSMLKIKVAPIIAVEVTSDTLTFHLEDGRTLSAPIDWFPRLVYATDDERRAVEIIGGGDGAHWPLLDEFIPLRALFSGVPSPENADSLTTWKKELDRRRRSGALHEPWGEMIPLPGWWNEKE